MKQAWFTTSAKLFTLLTIVCFYRYFIIKFWRVSATSSDNILCAAFADKRYEVHCKT